jgi:4-carboxymuconolactone decarboxylase
MAILLVARRWTAQYEWWAHRQLAALAGLDAGVADAIASRRRPELDGNADAVYQFAVELLDSGRVTDSSWHHVVDRWSERGAMDLIAVLGYYTLVAFTLNVDRHPVPGGEEPLGAA